MKCVINLSAYFATYFAWTLYNYYYLAKQLLVSIIVHIKTKKEIFNILSMLSSRNYYLILYSYYRRFFLFSY